MHVPCRVIRYDGRTACIHLTVRTARRRPYRVGPVGTRDTSAAPAQGAQGKGSEMTYPHTGPPGLVARVTRSTIAFCLLGLCVLAVSMAGASKATAATAAPTASTHPLAMTDRATTYIVDDDATGVAVTGSTTSLVRGQFSMAVAGGALATEVAWTADRLPGFVLPVGQRGDHRHAGALQEITTASDIDHNSGVTALGTAPLSISSSHADPIGLGVASGDRIGALTPVVLALLLSYLASLGLRGPTVTTAADSRRRVRAGLWSRAHGSDNVRVFGPPVHRRERPPSHALCVTGGC